ncbi:helix-turn-helix domain-containing protein [Haloarcula montana]|uniref:helix-turn-helix domain-containing protein n=1 Tax=Haloarcula montana TaxID=3111776 RepID=UPI002D77C59B|nr:helix-turn-helix domain-containing protein [Haloarcula sp. GH36]
MSNSADDGRDENSPPSTATFTTERVISVFEGRRDFAKPLTANDVMEALGCSRRTAHDKLDELVEQGTLETRKVGARSRIWWVPIPRRREPEGPAELPRDPLVDISIANADLPGSGELLERRRDALRASYDYLREHPDTDHGAFLNDVFPEHPAGYTTADEWWDAIGPALESLPDVEIASDSDHVWHYGGG